MSDKKPSKVAEFIEREVAHSKYNQKEIAEMAGYKTANVITMVKQGLTKLSIERIPGLAKALKIEPYKLFCMAEEEYEPNKLKVIKEIFGEPISKEERLIIEAIREVASPGDLKVNKDEYIRKIIQAIG